jgi:two-component system sensor histidine kinase/response regulator
VKILVVENEIPVLENIIDLLEAEGFQASAAVDGEDAYQKILLDVPDLIVCDIRMPRLGGLGLLARISQDPKLTGIPFIFLTAMTERSDLRAAMELGADDYITKPFSRRDLLEAIRRRLQKHEVITAEAARSAVTRQSNLSTILPLEILQPIYAIINYADRLTKLSDNQGGFGEARETEVSQTANQISHTAQHLLRSVANYIQLIDFQSEDTARHKRIIPDILGDVSATVIEEMAESFVWENQRASDLDMEIAPALLRANESVLQQIIEELLANAFQRTPPGSTVRIIGEKHNSIKCYRIVVTDYGSWFSSSQTIPMDGWGEEQQRADSGVGVGLLLVQKLAERSGGLLNVTSGSPGQPNQLEVIFSLA